MRNLPDDKSVIFRLPSSWRLVLTTSSSFIYGVAGFPPHRKVLFLLSVVGRRKDVSWKHSRLLQSSTLSIETDWGPESNRTAGRLGPSQRSQHNKGRYQWHGDQLPLKMLKMHCASYFMLLAELISPLTHHLEWWLWWCFWCLGWLAWFYNNTVSYKFNIIFEIKSIYM